MTELLRQRGELLRLPIVEVDFAVSVWKDPEVRAILVGGRRQVVETALRVFEEAKQNQIDGCIEVEAEHARILLLAMGVTQAWMRDLLLFRFDDDEQS
jgi:hypothetical protein